MSTSSRAAVMRRIAERTARAEAGARVHEFTERLRSVGVDVDEVLGGVPAHRVEAVAGGEIARSGLARQVPFEMIRAEGGGEGEAESDGLTIEGYGAVFDSVTEINSWEGHFQEKIRKGAFRKTLREQTPIMQFDHGHHPLLGSLPLGRWTTAEEDDHGLHVVGRMYDNWLTEPFRQTIADPDGGVTGMSFRFSVVREEWRDAQGKKITDDQELFELLYFGAGDRGPITRELVEVKAPEVGPVVWPAYADTEVGARSADGGTLTIDLAALRADPRRLADVAALIDAETRQAAMRLPLARITSVVAGLDASSGAGAVQNEPVRHTEPVHTPSLGEHTEPPATDRPAAPHSRRESQGTEPAPAGEHSSSAQQSGANPTDRRERIRASYRERLNRVLTLPDS